MMSLSPPISATQASHYHQEHFASATERYYSKEDGSAQGVWRGKLAGELGLSGAVVREDFLAIAEGKHPHTGEVLVRDRGKTKQYTNGKGKSVKPVAHRAAFDAQFAPPKSFSVQSVFDKRLLAVHNRAVEFAVREALEPYVQARVKSNEAHTTGRGLFAVFQHDSARPVDGFSAPQLHSHVLVMNLSASNGKTYALQPQELYRAQTLAGAVYDSCVAREAIALGYELERGATSWEVRGYSRQLIEEMSKRSQAMDAYMQAKGVSGPKAAEIAAHMTREAKDESQTPEVMREKTLALAAEHGIDPLALAAGAEQRQGHVTQTAEEAWKAAHASLNYARDDMFEREAVNGERRLIAEALKRSMGDTGFHEVRRALDSRLRSGELVAVEDKGIERQLTTLRMIDLESSNLARLGFLAEAGPPLVSRSVEPSGLENLSAEQRRAVQEIIASTAGVTALEARAGTGKTSRVLATVKTLAEADGYSVRGIAPTSRASKELRRAGIESSTLQKFLVEKNGEAEGKRLLILDEASLASTKGVHELLNRIGPQDRLLFCGDSKQHEAVEAGAPFRALQKVGVKTVKLEAILRQKDPALLHAVEVLAEGNTKWAVGELIRQGRVTEVESGQERLLALAKDFARAPEGTLAIAPSNEERVQLNQAIRTELQSRGQVSPGGEQFRVLVPRNELTGAGRAWAGHYEAGDVIRYSHGSAKLGIQAGEYARVVDVDRESNVLAVQRADGEVARYDPARLRGVAVFKEVDRIFAVGDRVQLTSPFNAKRLANRELATLEQIDFAGNLALRLDGGERVRFNLREHPCLDYGYAVTSHSSQGATAERALILADSAASIQLVNQRMAYVAVSRAASDVRIYTGSAAELVSKLSRENSKMMALDYALGQGKPAAKRNELATGA
jgi:conjugative relaxase-like TrwC/TraI family protein